MVTAIAILSLALVATLVWAGYTLYQDNAKVSKQYLAQYKAEAEYVAQQQR